MLQNPSPYRVYPPAPQTSSTGSGAFQGNLHIENFTPTNNQTSFTLQNAPSGGKALYVAVNGVITQLYTIQGTSLNYLDTDVILEPSDSFTVAYFT
jgi:hypothetical protein